MNNSWVIMSNFALISFLIVFAAVLKARIPLLKKWIIPTSMIAGILGYFLGPEILGVLPLDIEVLGEFVYHLMGIGFIALSLKERKVDHSPSLIHSGMLIVSTYLIQGIVGLGLFLILSGTLFPDLFPGVGLLLPLGYGQGPGQAYSTGSQWEQLGLAGGGNLGLTIAGFGFLWATFVGILLMNVLIRSKKYKQPVAVSMDTRTPIIEKSEPGDIPLSDAMDKLSYQIALIGMIYLLTFLTLSGISKLLTPLGTYGVTLSQLFIGFHFLIGSLYAMIFRGLLNRMEEKGFHLEHSPNNFMLQRISGFSFDFMIAASIAAISIHALREYFLPVMILTTLGGLITIFFVVWMVPRIFPDETLPNILGFYGMLTGTISTGMALLKAVDPTFQSSTPNNLIMGSAPAILFGFPLLLILNMPIIGWLENQPIMYLYTFALILVYFCVLIGILWYRTRKKDAKKSA